MLSFQKMYYFTLRENELVHCDKCKKEIKGLGELVYIIVPCVRNDETVDSILCEECSKKE